MHTGVLVSCYLRLQTRILREKKKKKKKKNGNRNPKYQGTCTVSTIFVEGKSPEQEVLSPSLLRANTGSAVAILIGGPDIRMKPFPPCLLWVESITTWRRKIASFRELFKERSNWIIAF